MTLRSEDGGGMYKEMCHLRENFQSFASTEDVADEPMNSQEQEECLCFDTDGKVLPLHLHKGAVVLSVRVPSQPESLAGDLRLISSVS